MAKNMLSNISNNEFFGMQTYANARRMIDFGCDVAVASDYNPGSSTIYSIPSVMTLATLYCDYQLMIFKAVTLMPQA